MQHFDSQNFERTDRNLSGTRVGTIDRGRRLFFEFRQIFPKTRPWYPVNFDRILATRINSTFSSSSKLSMYY